MKGRKKNESNLTIIKDPNIEPYFISKDNYSYTIFKNISPQETNNITENSKYIKSFGHFSDFKNCLKALVKHKIEDKKEYSSIGEYIKAYETNIELLSKILNKTL
jgi:hypothetical protein